MDKSALEDAILKYGVPLILNSDQGSQFTSDDFTGMLNSKGKRLSQKIGPVKEKKNGRIFWVKNVNEET